MSPNVGNFVHDLVEMAKAMEELPKVQDELAQARRRIAEYDANESRLMANAERLQDKINALIDNQHKLEVERDDALLRFLELEDKLGKVAKTFQTALEAMDMADKVVTQATAKPEPDYGLPTHEPPVQQGNESVQDPTTALVGSDSGSQPTVTGSAKTDASAIPSQESHSQESHSQPQGERVPDPTASSMAGDDHSSETAPATTVPTTESASGQEPRLMSASDKPFRDRVWSEVNRNKDALTGWWQGKMMTYTGWLEGGGAAEDWTR